MRFYSLNSTLRINQIVHIHIINWVHEKNHSYFSLFALLFVLVGSWALYLIMCCFRHPRLYTIIAATSLNVFYLNGYYIKSIINKTFQKSVKTINHHKILYINTSIVNRFNIHNKTYFIITYVNCIPVIK